MKIKFKKSIQNSRVVNCGRILEKPFSCTCCKKTWHVIFRLVDSLCKKREKNWLKVSPKLNIPTSVLHIL